MSRLSDVARASARWLTLALLALLPLIVWPGVEQPFSIPKFCAIGVTFTLLIPLTTFARNPLRWQERGRIQVFAVLWIVSWMASTFLGDGAHAFSVAFAFATAMFAILVVKADVDPARMAMAMVVGATALAIIALAQAFGADPFALFGWAPPIEHGSPRLRVYGTLGNPNFVAALLTATTPLTVGLLVRRLRQRPAPRRASQHAQQAQLRMPQSSGPFWTLAAALALQLAAIIATGSRAGALGLFVAAMTWAALLPAPPAQGQPAQGQPAQGQTAQAQTAQAQTPGQRQGQRQSQQRSQQQSQQQSQQWRRWRIAIASAGAILAVIAVIVSTARPLDQTIAGRAYIVSVAAPHAFEAPIFGRGPGAFEALYPDWERESRSTQQSRSRPPFAGPQQHAHNDYLEALIERGLFGLVTILIILATSLRNAWRLTRRTHDASVVVGAAAMLAALAAIACVDFPFARPTELTWFWSGVVMIILSAREASGDADGTLDDVWRVGADGPDDRAGPGHDRRGHARGKDEVLGKA